MDLLMLIPQELSLFDYYRRFGYRTAFWVEERQVKARREEEGRLSSAGPEDLPEVAELYGKALGTLFSVDRTPEDFALQQELYGDKALVLRRDGRLTAWDVSNRREKPGGSVKPWGPMLCAWPLLHWSGWGPKQGSAGCCRKTIPNPLPWRCLWHRPEKNSWNRRQATAICCLTEKKETMDG